MNIINKIRDRFIEESKQSIMLLEDLASMESYIAESYHSRSVIELLQNADDALANRFYVIAEDDYIIVANDGRYFEEKDIMSICRSGSSTKKRDGKSIGYRGIGFKSVINLAERVHIISSELKMTFSKELTMEALSIASKVPLIRIPHPYTPILNHDYNINKLIKCGYNTIFIFEKPNLNNLREDINSLDSSVLLFLNNITEFKIELGEITSISVDRKKVDSNEIISIDDKKFKERWLVSKDDGNNGVAFILNENDEIVSLDEQRAVIHSFMPTKDKVGIPIKINGDFSTDPSRTKVVYDDITKNTLTSCSKIIVNLLKNNLNNNNNYYGIFTILGSYSINIRNKFTQNIKIEDRFIESLKDMIQNEIWFNGNDTSNIRINPEWLNCKDFKRFCKILNLVDISKELEKTYPGIINFSQKFGIKTLDIEELLELTKSIAPSIKGSSEIICEFIKKYRFNCNEEILKNIKDCNLIHFKSGIFSYNKLPIDDSLILNQEFYTELKNQITDINDIKWFITKLFDDKSIDIIKINKIDIVNDRQIKNNSNLKNLLEKEIVNYKPKTSLSPINKWRSVEKNLASFIELEDNVKSVIDVSKSNLGYDIEVHYNDNTIKYIEVKSVERLGSAISLTNNEYSTANELKEDYLLAIVNQTDNKMSVCYIKNPISVLSLIKRITRWEWICDDYDTTYLDYYFK